MSYSQAQLDVQIANLKNAICDDYNKMYIEKGTERHARWWTPSDIKETRGKKYLKLVTPMRSVWGFVVIGKDKDFPIGTILKAASFKAPARNHSRGNIFTGYIISWTGASYCHTKAHDQNTMFAEQAKFNDKIVDTLVKV